MKALKLMLLVFLLAGSAAAQGTTNTPGALGAPGVEVIKNSWRKSSRNLNLGEDPLLIAQQQVNLQNAQREALRENEARAKADTVLPPVPIPTQDHRGRVMPPRPRVEYIYEVKVKNTGTKTIRRLVWEYVSSDSGTRPKARPRQYESAAKIRPGKTKNLVVYAPTPPSGVIDAAQASKTSQGQTSEQLVIQRVEYDDGSVWTRATN